MEDADEPSVFADLQETLISPKPSYTLIHDQLKQLCNPHETHPKLRASGKVTKTQDRSWSQYTQLGAGEKGQKEKSSGNMC